uniref:hypothetical protein n=1 Tax=Serratia proteamaculans TaxID=28151 RepID=UPI001F4BE878|nr:hypothetical protein [Serratia proteamaculans]ULG13378.1 hypothetical protein AGR96Xp_00009 [Serratia proteamaculans]ULG17206.1 hypothetical protein 20093p_00108 [Serratia proteamaculans]ULG18094.1 hypothetical protein LCp1_00108 [Serratia proteamaculans]ULG19577.1 hypothetical protein Sprot5p_00087 [Serratia proteamaculans]
MSTEIPTAFTKTFKQLWQLPKGMDQNAVMKSQEFLILCDIIDIHCYAQIKGMLFHIYLLWGLQKLGVPCFFDEGSPLAATDWERAAAQCYKALMQRETHETYLCPLDWAGDIPNVNFGNAAIRRFSAAELNSVLNPIEHQRMPGFTPVDTVALSKFSWLVVKHELELPAAFNDRFWLSGVTTSDQKGTVYPYKQTHYPEAVEKAIFLLMLAPWEDWMSDSYSLWCPFDIPWVHTLHNDIFQWQRPMPGINTLTWFPGGFMDENKGEWVEIDVPAERNVYIRADQLDPYVDESIRRKLAIAIKNGFINTAALHQFFKAFTSTGADEFLAHIVVIDACVGTKMSGKIKRDKRFSNCGATCQLKYRLAGLLNDASIKDSLGVLYDARSDYVHGNSLDKIEGAKVLLARKLARETLLAVLDVAAQSPSLTREDFLHEALMKGWFLIEGK